MVTLLALTACHGGKPEAETPAVVVALPVDADAAPASTTMRYPVEAAPRYSNPMAFRIAGKLIERKVRIGATVKKGEVVAQLDPIDTQKQVASAQAVFEAGR